VYLTDLFCYSNASGVHGFLDNVLHAVAKPKPQAQRDCLYLSGLFCFSNSCGGQIMCMFFWTACSAPWVSLNLKLEVVVGINAPCLVVFCPAVKVVIDRRAWPGTAA
jgi:hypothetical protein